MSDSDIRAFYNQAYGHLWARPDETAPGRRFSKMWYRSFLQHVVPKTRWEGKRVLEIGAGYGYLATALCSLGATYVGIDIAQRALLQFPKLASCHPVVADGCKLPFADHSFDCVICMEVIEHLEKPAFLIKESLRVSRETLIFSCPNYLNLFGPVKVLANIGLRPARRYMNHQIVDRTTTAFQLRRFLSRDCRIVLQRAIRIAPPFFEKLDWAGYRRANDGWFWLEDRLGQFPPFNFLGLHTLCVAEKRDRRTQCPLAA